jgi:hypothetical protein
MPTSPTISTGAGLPPQRRWRPSRANSGARPDQPQGRRRPISVCLGAGERAGCPPGSTPCGHARNDDAAIGRTIGDAARVRPRRHRSRRSLDSRSRDYRPGLGVIEVASSVAIATTPSVTAAPATSRLSTGSIGRRDGRLQCSLVHSPGSTDPWVAPMDASCARSSHAHRAERPNSERAMLRSARPNQMPPSAPPAPTRQTTLRSA